jgi:hypothetical protein
MTKDEIKKARESTIEELQMVLAQVDKEEADDRVERTKRFNGVRNEARSRATAQLVGLLDAAMILLDEDADPAPAPPPAAKTAAPLKAAAEPQTAQPTAQPTAPKTGGPRPVARALPSTPRPAPADSELPDAGSVFG